MSPGLVGLKLVGPETIGYLINTWDGSWDSSVDIVTRLRAVHQPTRKLVSRRAYGFYVSAETSRLVL
jgi:hypothetical protein